MPALRLNVREKQTDEEPITEWLRTGYEAYLLRYRFRLIRVFIPREFIKLYEYRQLSHIEPNVRLTKFSRRLK